MGPEGFMALMDKIQHERYGDMTTPAPGQIWHVRSEVRYPDGHAESLEFIPGRPQLVVLMRCDDDFLDNPNSVARVLPIGGECTSGSSYDLVFASKDCPLGTSCMIECWNSRPALRMNLVKPIAKLTDEMLQDVRYLLSCSLDNTLPTNPLQSKGFIYPPIEDPDDFRIAFQKAEFARTDFLSEPVHTLNA